MANKKPTKLLELNGAYRKNPQRRRDPEPIPAGPLGDPPARLQGDALAYWHEIVNMVPPGVLMISDRFCVEIAARLMAKAVAVPNLAAIVELAKRCELSTADVKTLVARETISSTELSILRSMLSAMGMTPADRSKLSIQVQKPENEFASMAAQAKALRRPN